MTNFRAALWGEFIKARRSKVPLFTLLGFSIAPLFGGFFMLILKDPELAKKAGMISVKAQTMAASADWPTFFRFFSQAAAVGGILLFGLVTSWVFGREFSDRTLKDLIALPTSRSTIVGAKFVVTAVWSAALSLWILVLGILIGGVIGLSGWSFEALIQGTETLLLTTLLSVAVLSPIAFFAGVGRGYLAPMGIAILALVLAQVIGAAGWGEYFPWSVPALQAGMVQDVQLQAKSYWIVLGTSLTGLGATFIWWKYADQTD